MSQLFGNSRPPSSPSRYSPSPMYSVIPRSVHDIHSVRIDRGRFQARKPLASRGKASGETRNVEHALTLPLLASVGHLFSFFFFSLPLPPSSTRSRPVAPRLDDRLCRFPKMRPLIKPTPRIHEPGRCIFYEYIYG